MIKVVINTNILVSALWSKQGNPFRIIEMLFAKDMTLYYTDEMIDEYKEVLCREKFGFSNDRVESLLHELTKNGVPTDSTVSATEFADETDRKFYDAAKANGAILITGNIKHYPDQPFILTTYEFLRIYGTSG